MIRNIRPKPPVANITAVRAEDVQLAVGDAVGHDAPRDRVRPAVEQQVDDVVLVEELDAVLDALLVERLQDHVAGPVGGEARAADRRLAVVAGVAAEPALVDLAVGRPVERQAHVLQLDDRLDRLARQDLGRVLVDQVVAALDRVVHVPLPVVLLLVAEGGADAALGGAGVGAGRVQLGQDRGLDAVAGQLERGPQAGAAGADDDRLVVVDRRRAVADRHVTARRRRQRQDDLRADDEQQQRRACTGWPARTRAGPGRRT